MMVTVIEEKSCLNYKFNYKIMKKRLKNKLLKKSLLALTAAGSLAACGAHGVKHGICLPNTPTHEISFQTNSQRRVLRQKAQKERARNLLDKQKKRSMQMDALNTKLAANAERMRNIKEKMAKTIQVERNKKKPKKNSRTNKIKKRKRSKGLGIDKYLLKLEKVRLERKIKGTKLKLDNLLASSKDNENKINEQNKQFSSQLEKLDKKLKWELEQLKDKKEKQEKKIEDDIRQTKKDKKHSKRMVKGVYNRQIDIYINKNKREARKIKNQIKKYKFGFSNKISRRAYEFTINNLKGQLRGINEELKN